MDAIPTRYQGRMYRSRLEARWAKFFDLLGWRYEYEPYDLPGWIPDFVIFGHYTLLVEVKPTMPLEGFPLGKIEQALLRSGPEFLTDRHEVLLLGCSIEPTSDYWLPRIGWISERSSDDPLFWPAAALLFNTNGEPNKYGLCHAEGWYIDRISGAYDGDGHMGSVDAKKILEMWNEAGNRTQWNPPTTSG